MKKNTFLIILIFLISVSAYSYQKYTDSQLKLLFPSSTRIINDLTGNWQVEFDNSDEPESRFVPFSDQYNRKITMTRNIKMPPDMIENYTWHLNFIGIESQVEVYWNEQFIGRYFDGIIPFDIRIPDRYLSTKGNQLKLIIFPSEDTRKQMQSQHLQSRKVFSGPIREIMLIGTPQIWISDIQHQIDFSNSYSNAYLKVNFNLSSGKVSSLIKKLQRSDSLKIDVSEKFGLNYSVSIIDKQTGTTLSASNIGSAEIESERTIKLSTQLSVSGFNLWSIENPYLYDLKVKVTKNEKLLDEYSIDLGFREFKMLRGGKNTEIQLNGKPFKLKGISYIEDYLNSGQTISNGKMKEDIENIKTLGANVIRMKYSPPHPYLVKLCNTNGILLMLEVPLYEQPLSIIGMNESKVFMKNVLNQLISNYNSNPSIFAYGFSDGIKEDEILNKDLYQSLIKYVKNNTDKLIYKIIPTGSSQVYPDGFDLIGLKDVNNSRAIDYLTNEFKRIKSMTNGKLLFIDFGTLIQSKNHKGYSDPLSIEYQSYKILSLTKIADANGGCGYIFNTYNDYLRNNPLLVTNNDDLYINTSGLVDRSRSMRLSFTTLQSVFNNEKEPLLNAGTYKQDTPVSFIIFGIAVGIALFIIINRFRRFREYMMRSILRPYNFYADIRDQRIISTTLTLLLGLILSFSAGIYLSSIFYFYRESLAFQYLLMIFLPIKSFQELFYKLIWMPELSLIILTLFSFLLAVIGAVIIKISAFFTRAKIWFSDCLTLSIWSAIPSLLLLPLGVVLFRVLLILPASIWFFAFFYIIMALWTIARMGKSISVVFDTRQGRVNLVMIILGLIVLGIPLFYYQMQFSTFTYLQYFFDVLVNF